MSFDNLNLDPQILRAVGEAGYFEATKVQTEAIPKILEGLDIRASAQTGTGKTAAFLLPALNYLIAPSNLDGKGPRILILVPTRELAMQIASQTEKFSKYLSRVRTVCIVGGVPYPPQVRQLSRPYEILIATPGRLIDFIHRKKINFSRLEMLVLDEADRMLDMGFSKPVEEIVAATPSSRQTLLFSATLRGSVLKLSEKLMDCPVEITVHANREKHENIHQILHFVDDLAHKNRLLDYILTQQEMKTGIVFTSTKRYTDHLVKELLDKGYKAAALHGDMNQRQRTRTINELRHGKIKILVATDVAARGIDIQSITHVINFDLPKNTEDYVHRIGRTGRAGTMGTAISFAVGTEISLIKHIEKFTGQTIEIKEIVGLEPRSQKQSSQKAHPLSLRRFENRRFKSKTSVLHKKSTRGRYNRKLCPGKIN
ncbi:MAG: DEAD/DEAH box helicase [Chlamydiia bacterium]|nr:DEAD/DEAH box helicase [Chlamydiia bacterium]